MAEQKRRDYHDLHKSTLITTPAWDEPLRTRKRDRQELVEEICCRIDQVPVLLTQAHVYPASAAILAGDLDYLLERATGASVLQPGEQIRQRYLQTAGGCRVGLCGCAYGRLPGRSTASGSSPCPHPAVPGCADVLCAALPRWVLQYAHPLAARQRKTTLLREYCAACPIWARISLMDERGEIAAVQTARGLKKASGQIRT